MRSYPEKPKRGTAENGSRSENFKNIFGPSTPFSFTVDSVPHECVARLKMYEEIIVLRKPFVNFTEIDIVPTHTASYEFTICLKQDRESVVTSKGDILRVSDDNALITGKLKATRGRSWLTAKGDILPNSDDSTLISGKVYTSDHTIALLTMVIGAGIGLSFLVLHLDFPLAGALVLVPIFVLILLATLFGAYHERRDFIRLLEHVTVGNDIAHFYFKKKRSL